MVVVLTLLSTEAVKIFPRDPTTVYKAVGSSAIFGCHFTLEDTDQGPLEIEWTIKLPDFLAEDPTTLLYTPKKTYTNLHLPLKDRVYLNSTDPSQGDVSIIIERLKWSDAGAYQCQVKKVPGIEGHKQILHLMAAPSLQSCIVEGMTYKGSDVLIKWHSNGTRPMYYSWDRIDGHKMPVSASVDNRGGTLHIGSATETDGGTYRCTAKNLVGKHYCTLELHVTQAMNISNIVIPCAVGGSLALILLAGLLCYCLLKRNKEDMEDIGNDFLENALPPARKSVTCNVTEDSTYCSMKDMRS
ncbi:coxsackievirus and adenovirus receptor homolog [Colossoma macropomum]|uniref:coxsackievirus and adenovirus receptor homolog n=1 Tax=Colossoma macropomum TaxID=42526 RepID=UPI0018645FA1|nr:coxsackievirus and adenovirus receptor homolog [Colossoma macropomum]